MVMLYYIHKVRVHATFSNQFLAPSLSLHHRSSHFCHFSVMTSIGSLLPKPKYKSGSSDAQLQSSSSGVTVTAQLTSEQRELLAKVSYAFA